MDTGDGQESTTERNCNGEIGMKVSIITPLDIRYSYKGTEWHVYEYAKYLKQNGIDADVLVTENMRVFAEVPNYKKIKAKYSILKEHPAACSHIELPLRWHLFIYKNLPKDRTIYFPYSIYDYIINILKKPKGQKYIIGCHGMHLKMGMIVKGNRLLESGLNLFIKILLRVNGDELQNIYCHALNMEQAEYIVKELGFKKRNVFCVPPLIETKQYELSNNTSHRFRVLHIGGRGKNIEVVFNTILHLSKLSELDKFEFYFIGDINEENKKQLKSLENVHFLGQINERQKMKIIKSVDAMIVPAYEVFPKTMLEGLTSGLYVLTSKRNASWRDMKKLKIDIFVSETGSALDYAEHLILLYERKKHNKKAFEHERRINRERVLKKFDREVVLQRMLHMFEAIG